MSEPVEKVTSYVDADEDLDELDDVLPEFNSPPTAVLPQKTTLGRKRTNTRVDQPPVSIPGSGVEPRTTNQDQVDDVLSDEFAKELEKLMKELVTSHGVEKEEEASGSGDRKEDQEAQKVFKAAWEAMLVEEMNGMTSGSGGEHGVDLDEDKDKDKGAPGDFQSKIKQTMDKLKESEDNLKAGSSSTAPDTLEGLFNSLQDVGDDTQFNGFLEEVMNQLMSKEVLYQPLKELSENFPPYLENPPEPITAEDGKRYEAQLLVIKEILAVFERPGYDDKDPKASKEIVDLMGELQSHGSPPEAVMGSSPMGIDSMPDNCVIG